MKNKTILNLFTIEWYSILKDIVLNFWLLILAAIIGFSSTFVLEQVLYKPVYTSSATLIVQVKTGTYQAYTNLSASSEMAVIFSGVFTQPSMKEKAAEYLQADEFNGTLNASPLSNTNVINLSVTADDPETAYKEIQAVLNVYPQISDTIFSNAVIDTVRAPEIPKGPSNSKTIPHKKLILLGFVGATLAGIVFISLLRDTIKSESAFNEKVGENLLGTILKERNYSSLNAFIKRKKRKKLVTEAFASFSFIENYQKIATKLEYLNQKKGDKIFLVTSVAAHEGKTTVSINTALTLARKGHRVALLDMDLMKPSVAKILEISGEYVDLSHVLASDMSVSQFKLLPYKDGNLSLGLNKRRHSSFTSWINRPSVKTVVDQIADNYDFVIIDSMPLSATAEVTSIAKVADKTIMVIKADYVKTGDVNDAVLTLNKKGCLAGCILNDAHKEIALFGQAGTTYEGYQKGRYGKYSQSRN